MAFSSQSVMTGFNWRKRYPLASNITLWIGLSVAIARMGAMDMMAFGAEPSHSTSGLESPVAAPISEMNGGDLGDIAFSSNDTALEQDAKAAMQAVKSYARGQHPWRTLELLEAEEKRRKGSKEKKKALFDNRASQKESDLITEVPGEPDWEDRDKLESYLFFMANSTRIWENEAKALSDRIATRLMDKRSKDSSESRGEMLLLLDPLSNYIRLLKETHDNRLSDFNMRRMHMEMLIVYNIRERIMPFAESFK